MRQQVADELRHVDALRALARLARHGALISENGFRQMLEPIALDLPELDELRALRLGDAAEREALQQPFHAGHRRLEFVAGELQQLLHVFALLLAALREQEQHDQAAGEHQRQQRGLADQHDVAAVVMRGDFDFALGDLLRRQPLFAREQCALQRESLLLISPRNRMVHQNTSDAVASSVTPSAISSARSASHCRSGDRIRFRIARCQHVQQFIHIAVV